MKYSLAYDIMLVYMAFKIICRECDNNKIIRSKVADSWKQRLIKRGIN